MDRNDTNDERDAVLAELARPGIHLNIANMTGRVHDGAKVVIHYPDGSTETRYEPHDQH
jgi:hypothetical protein